MGKNRVKYLEGQQKPYLIGVNVRESNYLDEDQLFEDERWDNMVEDYSDNQNNENNFRSEGISKEVDKFLQEKEKHIRRETIVRLQNT